MGLIGKGSRTFLRATGSCPQSLPASESQCTSPKHPVSCIEPGLAIHFLYDIIHVLTPLSHSHTQSLGPETAETQPQVYPGVGTPHLQGVLEAESPSVERVPEAVACPKCAPMVGRMAAAGPAQQSPRGSLHLPTGRTPGTRAPWLTVRAGSAGAARGSEGQACAWSAPGTVATSFLFSVAGVGESPPFLT